MRWSLVDRCNDDFRDVDVRGLNATKNNRMGYIFWIEWSKACIKIFCARFILPTHFTEFRVNKSWGHFIHAYGCAHQVNAQAGCDGFDSMFSRTINIAARLIVTACCWSYVNNLSAVACYHSGNNGASYVQQSFHIGINHRVPVIRIAFLNFISG